MSTLLAIAVYLTHTTQHLRSERALRTDLVADRVVDRPIVLVTDVVLDLDHAVHRNARGGHGLDHAADLFDVRDHERDEGLDPETEDLADLDHAVRSFVGLILLIINTH